MENKTLLGNETGNVQYFAIKLRWVDMKYNCIGVMMVT